MDHHGVWAPRPACLTDVGLPRSGAPQSGGPQDVGGAASRAIKAPTLNAVWRGSVRLSLAPDARYRVPRHVDPAVNVFLVMLVLLLFFASSGFFLLFFFL